MNEQNKNINGGMPDVSLLKKELSRETRKSNYRRAILTTLYAIIVKEIIDHTKPETTTPEEPEEELPNTGALWWPVPILACMGFTFILCGTKMRKKHEEE